MTRVYISSQSPILSFGEKTGQFSGNFDVGQVVVPDRIVQAERLVAVAPRVAGALVALDDDRRHPQLAQPGAERDPALAAADDDDLGLHLVAELARLALAHLQPRQPVGMRAVDGAGRAVLALGLLVALELGERREQRPRPAVAQTQVPGAAPDLRLERDPRLGHAVGGRRRLGGRPAARRDVRELGLEHGPDLVRALEGLDVPGERDEVAPEAVLAEQGGGGRRIPGGERLLEAPQPLRDRGGGLDCDVAHARSVSPLDAGECR